MSRCYRASPKPEEWLAARQAECMTVEEASAVINVDPSTWRGWESGKHTGPWHGLQCFKHECAASEDSRAA